jgi:hypothetical protein
MSVDISVSITEDKVDIIATPTVNIVNVTNSASIDPGLYDLSEFTNTSVNPFVRTSGLSSYVPTSRTLTINGTTQDLSADRTFTISTGITIGTTAITSGTVGRVLFEGTGNVVQESANLFWDNTNGRLGIGTSSPSTTLHVVGQATISTALSISGGFVMTEAGNVHNFTAPATNRTIRFITNSQSYSLFSTGNFAINTTTDAGFRLDVNGTARVQDDITVSRNKNQTTGVFISNTTNSASSAVAINLTSSSGEAVFAKKPALGSVYKTISGNDTYIYNGTAGDISILNDFATGRIKFAAGGASTAQMTLFSTGNLGINTTTDAGFRLDVNGTARVQDTLTVVKNQNLGTSLNITNTTSNFLAGAVLTLTSDASSGNAQLGKYSTTTTAYKTLSPKDVWIYNSSTGGDISILNDFATGQIKFAAGGASTAHMTIKSNGRINMSALPTSAAGLSAGDIWNDAGTLKIV